MPWREMSPMQQRLEFVRDYETDLFTMTELAAQYGISRKTGYKWVAAYDAAGPVGLQDRSRRPHTTLDSAWVQQRQRAEIRRGVAALADALTAVR